MPSSATEGRDFVCGDLSIADVALFPHLAALRVLGVAFSRQRHPGIATWLKRMRGIEACRAYLERARACIADLGARNLERSKIFGRGDRIEWVVARGDHDGFMQEIKEGRVLWPGLGVPGRETVPHRSASNAACG